MCDCASCEYTDSFREKSFAEWPRGNPAGAKRSNAAYAAHVAHSKRGGIERAIPAFTIKPEPHFDTRGLNMPVAPMPAWWYAWNNKGARIAKVERPKRSAPVLVAVTSAPEPGIAELLQRAIDMREERERKAA